MRWGPSSHSHHIYRCPSASIPFLENNTSVSIIYLFSFDLTNLIYLFCLCFNFFLINSWIIIICSLVVHDLTFKVALEITTYFNELFYPKVNYFITIFLYNTSTWGYYNFIYINDFLTFYCHCACPFCTYISVLYITEHYYYWFLKLIFIYIYQ